MKILFLLIIWFIPLLANSCFGAEMRIRVPEGNTYPPFFINDQNGRWTGLSIELVEALLQEAGHTPIYVPLPFNRGLKEIQAGKIDIMLNMSIAPERRSFMYFIGPQLDETILLVTRTEKNFLITSLDDLAKLPNGIGVERGKLYSGPFEKKRTEDKAFSHRLEEVTDIDRNEKKLNAGYISGFLGYGYHLIYQKRTNPLYKKFTIQPLVIGRDWVYFGFSKKSISEKQLRQLQNAYDRLNRRGILAAIRQKYRR